MPASFCASARPIVYTSEDETKATPPNVRRQVLEHNKKGRELKCGW